MAPPVPDAEIPAGWSAFMRTVVEVAAGLARAQSAACVRALWRVHRDFNLWRRVPDGLIDAVCALRAAGVPVCVVSNSEGRLRLLFEQLGIFDAFDLLLDSHVLGVEKPDPAIFHHALSHFGAAPARALHLGDVVSTDIAGARAAGVRAALIDPFGHYEGQHPDVPRVPSAAAVARALLAARR
jgi:putative hydrolase of the HAD superfamily